MLMRGSVRLAVKAKAWMPTQKEWTLAAQCIQPEEKERIGRFVFKKDAKSAMVSQQCPLSPNTHTHPLPSMQHACMADWMLENNNKKEICLILFV